MRKFAVSSTRTQYIVIEIPFEKFPHTADECVQMSTEPSALKVENRGDGTQAEHGKTRFSVEEVEVLVQEACAEATKRAFNMADERAFRRLEEFNQMYEDKMRTLLEKELTRKEELTLMYEEKIAKIQALMEKAQMAKQTPEKCVTIPEEDEEKEEVGIPLVPGTPVLLQGLQSHPELNGEVGMTIAFDQAKQRWQVEVPGRAKVLLLKAVNLQGMFDVFDPNDCDSLSGSDASSTGNSCALSNPG